jgi:hypothetical protein
MTIVTWPDTLPASPLLENFQEILPRTAIRTDMDTGPAKVRQRTTAGVGALMVSYLLNIAETIALDAFYQTTLSGGATAFDYTHPRTGATLSCRFTDPPEYAPVNGNYFKVTLTLEVLP